jgi:hypothetical protein
VLCNVVYSTLKTGAAAFSETSITPTSRHNQGKNLNKYRCKIISVSFNRVHKSSPLVQILSQTSLVHTTPNYVFLQDWSYYYPLTYASVFLVGSFLLPFPPITYLFVLPSLPISSSLLQRSDYSWRGVQFIKLFQRTLSAYLTKWSRDRFKSW